MIWNCPLFFVCERSEAISLFVMWFHFLWCDLDKLEIGILKTLDGLKLLKVDEDKCIDGRNAEVVGEFESVLDLEAVKLFAISLLVELSVSCKLSLLLFNFWLLYNVSNFKPSLSLFAFNNLKSYNFADASFWKTWLSFPWWLVWVWFCLWDEPEVVCTGDAGDDKDDDDAAAIVAAVMASCWLEAVVIVEVEEDSDLDFCKSFWCWCWVL